MKRGSNGVYHALYLLVQLMIAEPKNAKPSRNQPRCAAGVVPRGILLCMVRPVELDNELVRKADEIDNIGADRRLSAKLAAVELPGAQ
jgi:hypothetical protein